MYVIIPRHSAFTTQQRGRALRDQFQFSHERRRQRRRRPGAVGSDARRPAGVLPADQQPAAGGPVRCGSSGGGLADESVLVQRRDGDSAGGGGRTGSWGGRQDCVCQCAQRVPEAEAGFGARLGSSVGRRVGVRPALRRLRRRLRLLRLQGAAGARRRRRSARLRRRARRPAVPVRGMSEQSVGDRQVPEQGQGAAVHRSRHGETGQRAPGRPDERLPARTQQKLVQRLPLFRQLSVPPAVLSGDVAFNEL